MKRVPYQTMVEEFSRVLRARGFSSEDAVAAAEIFARNSLTGVYSHGLNRFPRLVSYLDRGLIDPTVKATCVASFGNMERWDGHRGFGPLNAGMAMQRACQLAKAQGIGLVALGNNNHWMRGGTYGWQAAEEGCIGICWSNTMPNMPAWGSRECRIGNNPLVMAIPRSNGQHVLVDCAMSQFSYGKLETTRLAGQQLPVPGGYNLSGELTHDPGEIEASGRPLPMGYWKGSGLSVLMDLIGTILSGGHSTATIGTFAEEVGVTQIMIAIDPAKFNTPEQTDAIAEQILRDLKASEPAEADGEVFYPGERSLNCIQDHLTNGIPVVEEIWDSVLRM